MNKGKIILIMIGAVVCAAIYFLVVFGFGIGTETDTDTSSVTDTVSMETGGTVVMKETAVPDGTDTKITESRLSEAAESTALIRSDETEETSGGESTKTVSKDTEEEEQEEESLESVRFEGEENIPDGWTAEESRDEVIEHLESSIQYRLINNTAEFEAPGTVYFLDVKEKTGDDDCLFTFAFAVKCDSGALILFDGSCGTSGFGNPVSIRYLGNDSKEDTYYEHFYDYDDVLEAAEKEIGTVKVKTGDSILEDMQDAAD